MSQKTQLLNLFRSNNNLLSLGHILNEPEIGYEWRARATELRKEGHQIKLVRRGDTPTQNLYRLIEKEPNGQMRLA